MQHGTPFLPRGPTHVTVVVRWLIRREPRRMAEYPQLGTWVDTHHKFKKKLDHSEPIEGMAAAWAAKLETPPSTRCLCVAARPGGDAHGDRRMVVHVCANVEEIVVVCGGSLRWQFISATGRGAVRQPAAARVGNLSWRG